MAKPLRRVELQNQPALPVDGAAEDLILDGEVGIPIFSRSCSPTAATSRSRLRARATARASGRRRSSRSRSSAWTGKLELGQNLSTSKRAAVAERLEARGFPVEL